MSALLAQQSQNRVMGRGKAHFPFTKVAKVWCGVVWQGWLLTDGGGKCAAAFSSSSSVENLTPQPAGELLKQNDCVRFNHPPLEIGICREGTHNTRSLLCIATVRQREKLGEAILETVYRPPTRQMFDWKFSNLCSQTKATFGGTDSPGTTQTNGFARWSQPNWVKFRICILRGGIRTEHKALKQESAVY